MSLKGDKYETAEEIKSRIEHTVVMYDGEPVYISRVGMPAPGDAKEDIARVFFYMLPLNNRLRVNIDGAVENAGGEIRKFLSSKKFDLAPFKMGYFNINNEAVFASRVPIRQYKQGLSAGTMSLTNQDGRPHPAVMFINAISSQGFADMVAGKYPSFQEAQEMLSKKGCNSVAISRTFCVRNDEDLGCILLVHKGARCGISMQGQKVLQLPPKYHFLRQEAEECRIPLA